MSLGPVLRPAEPRDRGLLQRIYAATRAEELAPVPWPDETKRAFIAHQFAAQDSYYREHYPTATFDVVVVDGADVGRLYVDRWDDQIRIIDIAILPEARARGIGSVLLRALIRESEAAGKPLTMHVEPQNRARRLYERLGFLHIEDRGAYQLYERPVDGQLKTAS